MKHYKARQLKDGTWEYTCLITNPGEEPSIYPVGYCGGWHDWSDQVITDLGEDAHSAHINRKEKYHKVPHSQKHEAIICYKNFLLDTAKYSGTVTPISPCEICRLPTTVFASVAIPDKTFILCNRHLNRESLEKLLVIDEIWEH